jgi:hypothetical protein
MVRLLCKIGYLCREAEAADFALQIKPQPRFASLYSPSRREKLIAISFPTILLRSLRVNEICRNDMFLIMRRNLIEDLKVALSEPL